jgi:hypothetical protein
MTKFKQSQQVDLENYRSILEAIEEEVITLPPDISPEHLAKILNGPPCHLYIAREWLIKLEWDRSYKIQQKKEVRDALKPHGMLLQRYFRLCERCHTLKEMNSQPLHPKITSVSEWFNLVFGELMGFTIHNTLYPPPIKIFHSNQKEAGIAVEKERLKMMKDGKNPFTQEFFPYLKIELHALETLINSALSLIQISEPFEDDFWKPFLAQYSLWIRGLKDPIWGRLVIENQKIYVRSGRGKGQQYLGSLEGY